MEDLIGWVRVYTTFKVGASAPAKEKPKGLEFGIWGLGFRV